MSRYIDADAFVKAIDENGAYSIDDMPSIDIVRCKECKHRPTKEDEDGEAYGFNVIPPTDGDERCPWLIEDGWYSWIPNDDDFCSYGERNE